MRAQQYSSVSGGLEKNLQINASAPLPKRKKDQHLIQVIAAALNPVDYKVPEIPLVTRFVLSKPAVPVNDVVGRVVQPADGSDIKPGQIIFGRAGMLPFGGALAEYTVTQKNAVAVLSEGLNPVWGAAANIAGLTAYQSIVPYVKDGSNVFINGGSGGTGIFGIQIAKAKGCYVATSCSTANVDLCKSLGADEVYDYKKVKVLDALKASGRKFDHVVDNVGFSPELYWKMHEYTTPKAVWMMIGAELSVKAFYEIAAMKLLPGFLGGGKRKHQGFQAQARTEDLNEIAKLMKEGKVKPIIDSTFKFEEAPAAFERMKTHRAKGKIIVEVNPNA